jgi:hypothetical protein
MRLACVDSTGAAAAAGVAGSARLAPGAGGGRRRRFARPAPCCGRASGRARPGSCLASATPTPSACARGCAPTRWPPAALRAASEVVRAALHRVAPRVERAWHDDRPDQPTGSFWLDGDGLDRLYPDRPEQPAGTCWGRAIATTIAELGLVGAVVVGHSRFATFALARAMRGGDSSGQGGRGADRRLAVYGTDADERAAARAVPLARLELAPELRDALARLGVFTLGQLVQLPGGGILERWGKDAHQLYQLAAGERWDPLVPEPPPSSPDERVLLDDEEHAAEGLMFALKPALDRLLDRLARRGRAVAALHLELTLRRSVHDVYRRSDCIKPASATLDGRSLLRLIRLRLDGQPPAHGAIALRVWADDTPASAEQLSLFAQRPRRDLRAASEAVARLRAELGDAAVVRAVLREGHLPEARFGWEPIAAVPAPRADAGPGADERGRWCAGCWPGRASCRRSRPTCATMAGCCPGSSTARWCGSTARTWCRAAGGRTSCTASTTSPRPAAAIACGCSSTASAGAGSSTARSSSGAIGRRESTRTDGQLRPAVVQEQLLVPRGRQPPRRAARGGAPARPDLARVVRPRRRVRHGPRPHQGARARPAAAGRGDPHRGRARARPAAVAGRRGRPGAQPWPARRPRRRRRRR